MPNKVPPNHILPDDYLTAIGRVNVYYSQLEASLQVLIWAILDSGIFSATITAELDVKRLRSLAANLYMDRFGTEEDAAHLKRLLGRAEQVEGRRNVVVHSIWQLRHPDNAIVRCKWTAKQKKGFKNDEIEVSVQEIETLAADIAEVYLEIWELATRIMDENFARCKASMPPDS